MTRLLILGSGGMTGSELSERAGRRGFEPVALDRNALDITNADAVIAAVAAAAPEVVINAAAYTGVDAAERYRNEAMKINGDGAGNVARAADAVGAALIHISTDYVFNGLGSEPYSPDDPPHPVNAYGASKLEGENQVIAAASRHALLRTSWVFSHRGRNFVRAMVDRPPGDNPIRIVDDQFGRPTSAADLAEALLAVAREMCADSTLAGTWHFANTGTTTWYEFALAIFEIRGGTKPVIESISTSEYGAAAPRPLYSVLDTSSFEQTFGITPRGWRDALRETVERIQ